MAEMARCGRRKQLNPQRKNVENDDQVESLNAESEQQSSSEQQQQQTNGYDEDKNSQPDADSLLVNEEHAQVNGDCNISLAGNGNAAEVSKRRAILNGDATAINGDGINMDIGKENGTEPKIKCPDLSAIRKKKHDTSTASSDNNNSSTTNNNAKKAEPLSANSGNNNNNNNTAAVDEKLQEYLNRSDTAVIFPQPVSDQDDDDTGDSLNNTDDELVLKCAHCSESFNRTSALRTHIKTMHSEKTLKFMCPKCEETFTLKSHLDNHMALHSATSQTCNVCKKTFANVYRLQRHMISHDESTDLRKFKCEQCGKAFKFKHHLKEHIRIHSGEKPFECSNCRKRFSHSGSYSSHMTSKKCWVMNVKGRRIDNNSNTDAMSVFPPVTKNGHSQPNLPLQNSSGTLPPQFIQFDHPTSGLPTFYATHINGNSPFMSYSVYSQKESVTDRVPQVTNQTVAHANSHKSVLGQKPPPPPPLPKSSKLSPDVNSNTQPLSMVMVKKSESPVLPVQQPTQQDQVTSPSPVTIKTEPLDPSEVSKDIVVVKSEDSKDCLLTSTPQEKNSDSPILPPSNSIDSKDVDLTCRFCASGFRSPVDLHQHERYLCKSNKDIVHRVANLEVASCNSPSSTTSSSDTIKRETPNGSIGNGTDEDDAEEIFKEENLDKKFRMRSLISDEQLQVLKKYYQINPRPRKHDLIKIGNEIGFPKRVVQVWFQNMRARDRKKGKSVPYFPSMARFKQQEESSTPTSTWKEPVKPANSAYIPNVPSFNNSVHVQSGIPKSSSPSFPAHSHSKVNGQFNAASENRDALFSHNSDSSNNSSQDQPLDLSLKREPPKAHSGHKPSNNNNSYSTHPLPAPVQNFDNQVLNLSCRLPAIKQEQLESSKSSPGSFQESALYKYMKQEGMIVNKPVQVSQSSPIPNQVPQSLKALAASSPYLPAGKPTAGAESDPKQKAGHSKENKPADDSSLSSDDSLDSVNGRSLVIDESKLHEKSGDECLSDDEDDDDDSDDDDDDDDGMSPRMTNGISDGGHNTSNANMGVTSGEEQETNPDGTKKPKRLRKKSWRQMEAEEIQLDLEDSITGDEDHSHRKKRRSWKSHRVDVEEGMYACDQCDKMFSKQSSLARHKYEHSGARPFTCDECPKAFKHKHHLTEHKRLHSGEKPFQCKKCAKRFSHSGSYSQHMNHRYKYCKPAKLLDEEEANNDE